MTRVGRFPAVEILTDRMRLRAYTDADVDAHTAIFDHAVARRWSRTPKPYTREHARAWCTSAANEVRRSGDGICWGVEDRATGQLIGLTGFHRTDWRDRVTDVSANGAATAIGHGYATQALRVISHWVLVTQRFDRIGITVAEGNRAPRLVAAAVGFVADDARRGRVRYILTADDLLDRPVPSYSVRQAPEGQEEPT
jgi:RimJ/RimL family protein N-acetyltransferase